MISQLVLRAWQAFATLISSYLIITYLTKDEQGIYFLILSIVGLQGLFELGLNTIIINYVSHKYKNNEDSKQFLRKCLDISRNQAIIYFFVAVLSLILILKYKNLLVYFYAGYIFLYVMYALDLYILPFYSAKIALGEIRKMYRYKIYRIVFENIALWVCLYQGIGLQSLAYSGLVGITIIFIFIKIDNFNKIKNQNSKNFIFNEEFMLLRSKFKLSWIIGWLNFSTIIPIAFFLYGSKESGKIGICMTFIIGIMSVSNIIVNYNNNIIAKYFSENNFKNGNKLFFKTFLISILIYLVGSVAFTLLIYFLDRNGYEQANRFLEIDILLIFIIGFAAHHIISLLMTYVFSCLKSPPVKTGIGCTVFTLLFMTILGWDNNVNGYIIGFTISSLFLSLPIYYLRYYEIYRKNNQLHSKIS